MAENFSIFVLGFILGGFCFVLIDAVLKFREEDKRLKELWLTKKDEEDEDAG